MESDLKVAIPQKKRNIYLRCVFMKIYKVDTVNEFYSGEVFLEAMWREPMLDNKSELKDINLSTYWNPRLSIENILLENKLTISLETNFDESTGEAFVIEKRRLKAGFRETLELQHFPFDCQDLSIAVATEYSNEEVELVESPDYISKLNTIDGMESQEWSMYDHVEVESRTIVSDCNIGPKERQVMAFTCRASRRFIYFIINHFLISCMFFLLTFTSFSIVSTNTFGRLNLCMTTLLTSVTFKVAVSQNLPKIPYLTYLDKCILGNILMIMCLCIWHAITSTWYLDPTINTVPAIRALERIEKILIPSLLGFYSIVVLVYSLIIYFDAGNRRREMEEKDVEFNTRIKLFETEQEFTDFT